MMNVGGLLTLFIYLYSVLGVFLFAHVKLNNQLSEHANFQTFGNAALTLFRISTGESWNSLMFDCGRQRSIDYECVVEQTYEEQQRDGIQGCGNMLSSRAFFISYMLLIPFIFLNLFIAIILEGFEKAVADQKVRITDESIDIFSQIWKKYDQKATGMID